jgi:hypothetical protein
MTQILYCATITRKLWEQSEKNETPNCNNLPSSFDSETATDKEISNARSGIGDFAADLDPTTTTWMNSHLPQGQDYALEFLLWIYVIMTAHHLQFWGKELVVTYYCLIFMLPGKEIVFMA